MELTERKKQILKILFIYDKIWSIYKKVLKGKYYKFYVA